MSTINVNGTSINYQLSGRGKQTLLFIHGSFIDQTYWDAQVDFFSPYYQLVTLDLAGHGRSGHNGDDWSAKRLAADLVAVIIKLDLQNLILIGHSFGSDITLMTAIQVPGRILGFIAIDYFKNAATPQPHEFEDQKAGILANLENDFAATNEQYVRTALITRETPPAITDRVVKSYRNAYEPLGRINVPELFEIYKTEAELLPQLPVKLHLINVDYQPTNLEALDQHTTNGYDLTEIKGTSHFPMIEEPQRLNEALNEVIKKIISEKLGLGETVR